MQLPFRISDGALASVRLIERERDSRNNKGNALKDLVRPTGDVPPRGGLHDLVTTWARSISINFDRTPQASTSTMTLRCV